MSVPSSPGRRGRLLGVGLLFAAAIGLYAVCLRAPFVFDDLFSVVEDPAIRSLRTSLDPRPGSNVDGRPLAALSLALNYQLGGLEVFGYRLVNLLLHGAAGAVLFLLLREALGAGASALTCALLWTVHPLCTDAVNMVVTRNEVLCALFYLSCLLLSAKGFRAERASPWFLGATVCAFLAAASKETAVALPVAVLLYDRTFVSRDLASGLRRHRGLYAGLFAAALFVLVLARAADRGANVGFEMGVPWGNYLGAQVEVLGTYLGLCLWPGPLVVDYGDWSVWQGARAPWIGAGVLAVIVGAGVVGFRRRSGLDLLAWIGLAALAPTVLIPMTNEVAGEHRMYLPLAAVLVALVVPIARCARGVPSWLSRSAVLALVVALGARTVARNQDYNDPVRLWGGALEAYPENSRAAVFLGDEHMRSQRFEAALRVYRKALEAAPRHRMLLARTGQVLRVLGRAGEAKALEDQAARGGKGPRYDALAEASAFIKEGDVAAGLERLRGIASRWPDFERARVRLATVLATTPRREFRDPDEAQRIARGLVEGMSPPNPAYLDLLGMAYASGGQPDAAIEWTQRARELALSYGLTEMAEALEAKIESYR